MCTEYRSMSKSTYVLASQINRVSFLTRWDCILWIMSKPAFDTVKKFLHGPWYLTQDVLLRCSSYFWIYLRVLVVGIDIYFPKNGTYYKRCPFQTRLSSHNQFLISSTIHRLRNHMHRVLFRRVTIPNLSVLESEIYYANVYLVWERLCIQYLCWIKHFWIIWNVFHSVI